MKRESGSQFTKTMTDNSNPSEQTSSTDTTLKPTYHQTCKTLIYDIYIRILSGEPNSLLIITGTPTDEELKLAWAEIMSEYSDIIKTPKSSNIFDVWKKCNYTYWKMCYVEAAVYKLRLKDPETDKYIYDQNAANELALLGYDYVAPPEDDETYLRQIELIEIEARNLVVILNQYTQEYKLLCPDEDTPVKRTYDDYLKELAILSKFMGQWIDKQTKTVSDVASIINAYIEAQNIDYAS